MRHWLLLIVRQLFRHGATVCRKIDRESERAFYRVVVGGKSSPYNRVSPGNQFLQFASHLFAVFGNDDIVFIKAPAVLIGYDDGVHAYGLQFFLERKFDVPSTLP